MPSFTQDGITTYYELWGDPSLPRLLVISPSNTPLNQLSPYLSGPGGFAKLDRHFHCLAYDHRGTGQSSVPAPWWPDPPSVGAYANDALALLSHVGWQRCHILAFSFGAAVTQELLLNLSDTSVFRPQRVLLVCPAIDVDGTPSGSYPLEELLGLSSAERCERMLLLADTRRDGYWLESEEGSAAMHYVTHADSTQRDTPGGFEGRAYQMVARRTHATLARLKAATGGDGGDASAASLPNAACAPVVASIASPKGEEGRLLGDGPPASASARAYGGAALPPLSEGGVGIFGAVYDAITPPHASMRLHGAMRGSQLVWFPTGHWPNLARESRDHFGRATIALLNGKDVPADVLQASKKAAEEIPKVPIARTFGGGGDCNCPDACAIS